MQHISALIFSEKTASGERIKKTIFCSEEAEAVVRIAELLNNWLKYLNKYDDINNITSSPNFVYYKSHLELMLKDVTSDYNYILELIFDSCNIYTNFYYDTPFFVESYLVVKLPQT